MSSQLAIPRDHRTPKAAGDETATFELLVDHLERGILSKPKHQRDADAWPMVKKRQFVEGLLKAGEGSHPCGVIVTYQVVSKDGVASPEFLNDGLQRLTTLRELKGRPEDYALTRDAVENLLRGIRVSVQHRVYPSHYEAMIAFQQINYGSHLTAYEIGRGLFVYMDDFDAIWRPLLESIHQTMADAAARLRGRERKEKASEHKHYRHNLALFHRFLTKEQRTVGYDDVGRAQIQDLLPTGKVIEQRLQAEFTERGSEEIAREIKSFAQFVKREVALIEQLRNEVLDHGAGLQAGLWRWLLDFAVWRRNVKVPVEKQKEFVKAMLVASHGTARWADENGARAITVAASRLTLLPTLAMRLGIEGLSDPPRRRSASNVREGYDESHIMPFATHGDGPVIAEPASLNRARGARPIPGLDP